MFPTLYEVQGVGLHTWGLMVTLAFLVAVAVVQVRAPRVGIEPDRLVAVYLWIGPSALLGARLLHFLGGEPGLLWDQPAAFFDPRRGGFAFLGGVVGGVAAAALICRRRGVSFWKFADLAAPALALGHALGRVGCFFAGCCHGSPVDAAVTSTGWTLRGGAVVGLDGPPLVGLIFRRGVGVGSIPDVPLYPTQIWEVGLGLLLFGGLSALWARGRRFDGQVLAVYLLAYGVLRAVIEGYRGDVVRGLHPVLGWTLSTSQLLGGGLALAAVALIAARRREGLGPEAPIRAPTLEELDRRILDEERAGR